MKLRLLLASVAAIPLAACGSSAADEQDTPIGAGEPVETAAPVAAAEPQAFVDTMAASDTFEIEAGKLAGEMGQSQKVKDFGAMMVKDHTHSSAKLKMAAAATQPAVTVTPKLTAEQEANLAALRSAGDDFDKVYAQQQVAAHEKALTTLREQASGGASPPLKDFASATATVVQHHLGMAQELP